MSVAFLIIASYLIGSFPSGYIVGWLFGKIDIRNVGSRQIGAANVTRQLGAKVGALALSLDLLKGLLPMFVTHYVLRQPMWVTSVCGIAAVFGHDFSIFLSFRGGEGLATSMAVIFFLAPSRFLLMAPFAIITALSTGYVTLGGIVQLWGYGVTAWVTGSPLAAVYSVVSLISLGLTKQTPWMMKNPPTHFMQPNFVVPHSDPVSTFEQDNHQ
ncbi:MAG: glycerol-3-phosphate acyltransferase [Caldisericales bacterium]|nr:glycerol-3-phosphate acyltransferase [Caldisericales bacterium]